MENLLRLLAVIPDRTLLIALRRGRGHGRNDYPVEVLWGVVLLTVVLRHTGMEACLQELRRNAPLRRLIGITQAQGVAKKWNISRFLEVLGQKPYRDHLTDIFNAMIRVLGSTVEDLGQRLRGDSTALCARGHKIKVAVASSASGQNTLSLPAAAHQTERSHHPHHAGMPLMLRRARVGSTNQGVKIRCSSGTTENTACHSRFTKTEICIY